jgi:hypothetical protein
LVEFIANALTFSMQRAADHQQSGSQPFDTDLKVLAEASRMVGWMTPAEAPEKIWQRLLEAPDGDAEDPWPPAADGWSAAFLEAFYQQNLVAPSPRFVELALQFVATAMAPSRRFKDTATWLAVFGFADSTLHLAGLGRVVGPVKGWEARHENLALQLWPHIVAWLGDGPSPALFVEGLARWLRTEAASGFRLSALATFRAVSIGQDDRWARHDRGGPKTKWLSSSPRFGKLRGRPFRRTARPSLPSGTS